MAKNKRQKKKQQKQKEIKKMNSTQIKIDENIENAKEELKQFEQEEKMEILEEDVDNEIDNKKSIKTEEDFNNKLDDIFSKPQESENEIKNEIDEDTKKKATSTAEKIAEEYKDTETFTMKDITKMMRNSGLSYRQIMQQMKAIGKATEEYAATQGDDFDRKEFLRKQMEQRLGKK